MLEILKRTDISAYENKSLSSASPRPEENEGKAFPVKNLHELKKEEKSEKVTPLQQLEEEKKDEKEVTQEMLNEISDDVETLYSVGLQFAKHNDSGRTMVKVINKDTDELIREIPAEKVLDMAAKMEEMIGMLFDHEA